MARAISQASFLITISGYSGRIFFSNKSGGSKKANSSTYNDGLARANKKVVGAFVVDDLTLERAFDPEVDPAFIKFLSEYCQRDQGDFVVTVQPIENCTQANPIGSPFTYSGCQFMGVEVPDVDRSSDSVAVVKYMFSADDLTTG
jgi:hypothetical protein